MGKGSGWLGEADGGRWTRRGGSCLHSRVATSWRPAVPKIGAGRLVASTHGDLLFYSHCGGRDLSLLREKPGAHGSWTEVMAVCGVRILTTLLGNTAAVWFVY